MAEKFVEQLIQEIETLREIKNDHRVNIVISEMEKQGMNLKDNTEQRIFSEYYKVTHSPMKDEAMVTGSLFRIYDAARMRNSNGKFDDGSTRSFNQAIMTECAEQVKNGFDNHSKLVSYMESYGTQNEEFVKRVYGNNNDNLLIEPMSEQFVNVNHIPVSISSSYMDSVYNLVVTNAKKRLREEQMPMEQQAIDGCKDQLYAGLTVQDNYAYSYFEDTENGNTPYKVALMPVMEINRSTCQGICEAIEQTSKELADAYTCYRKEDGEIHIPPLSPNIDNVVFLRNENELKEKRSAVYEDIKECINESYLVDDMAEDDRTELLLKHRAEKNLDVVQLLETDGRSLSENQVAAVAEFDKEVTLNGKQFVVADKAGNILAPSTSDGNAFLNDPKVKHIEIGSESKFWYQCIQDPACQFADKLVSNGKTVSPKELTGKSILRNIHMEQSKQKENVRDDNPFAF